MMLDRDVRRAWLERLKALDELDKLYPGWDEIVGEVGSATPFRKWLGTQPADYCSLINDTDSPSLIAEALRRFHIARLN